MTTTILLVSSALALGSLPAAAQTPPITRLAPFVASPQNVVEKMLEVANLKPGETLYDLGSGDGRVLVTAAQRFGAKAVGVEISPKEAKESRDKIARLQLSEKCSVVEGDLLATDLSPADVVTIYLLTKSNDKLRPNLEKYLKPGARVVSHDYKIPGWTPKEVVQVEAHRRVHSLYLYEIPARK
ncbi:MAG: class I SAM-dependent methyltransferase [Bryobacteraceae bacterium]